MALFDAPQGAPVPRALTVQTSYLPRAGESSVEPSKHAEFTDISGDSARATWLNRRRVGDALVRAAHRVGRPLDTVTLVAAANLGRWVTKAIVEDVITELVAAGRLICEERPHPRSPLFVRTKVYSAPRGA